MLANAVVFGNEQLLGGDTAGGGAPAMQDAGEVPMSTLPHHVSERAGDNLRKVISQIIDLACDAAQFPIEVIKPRRHVESDVPQLAGDEAERSFCESRVSAKSTRRFRSLSSFSKSTAIAKRDGPPATWALPPRRGPVAAAAPLVDLRA